VEVVGAVRDPATNARDPVLEPVQALIRERNLRPRGRVRGGQMSGGRTRHDGSEHCDADDEDEQCPDGSSQGLVLSGSGVLEGFGRVWWIP
jgi:hypothetical protein